jgi:hypothetical protein
MNPNKPDQLTSLRSAAVLERSAMNMRIPLLLTSWCLVFLSGCYYPGRGFLESAFDLKMESRLPKPFDSDGKIAPSGYTAKVEFYSPLPQNDQKNVRLAIYDPNGKKIFDEMGASWWHPSGSYQGGGKSELPTHTVISINGITDILEKREIGPILYLTDDEELWKFPQKAEPNGSPNLLPPSAPGDR